ncbi:MAG: hypothetical protein GY863_12060 [bacterium]|nr:hypothetical protein [bacterium]
MRINLKRWYVFAGLLFTVSLFYYCTSETNINTFQLSLGGEGMDRGVSVVQTSDGGYVFIGVTESFGNGKADIYLIRTDQRGDTLWTKTYGGTENDNGWSVLQSRDEGFVVTGYTESYGEGNSDIFLLKTDAHGDQEWLKTYGGPGDEYGWHFQQTIDGGFIIAAQTGGDRKTSNVDAYLIKTDHKGNIVWSNTYGGDGVDRIYSVQVTEDNGYIACGTTDSFGAGNIDAYVIRIDSEGRLLWSKTFGGSEYDVGHFISKTSDGGFIITGYGQSLGTAGNNDPYLIKIDGDGNKLWIRTYGGIDDDRTLTGSQTFDGGFILTGYTKSFGAGNWDAYLIKTDAKGDTVWTRTFGGQYPDTGYIIHQAKDGGFIFTGDTWSYGNGRNDMFIVKTDRDGRVIEK